MRIKITREKIYKYNVLFKDIDSVTNTKYGDWLNSAIIILLCISNISCFFYLAFLYSSCHIFCLMYVCALH